MTAASAFDSLIVTSGCWNAVVGDQGIATTSVYLERGKGGLTEGHVERYTESLSYVDMCESRWVGDDGIGSEGSIQPIREEG